MMMMMMMMVRMMKMVVVLVGVAMDGPASLQLVSEDALLFFLGIGDGIPPTIHRKMKLLCYGLDASLLRRV